MILKVFPNVVTKSQQYNIGEKPTVILCILTLIAMQGHQNKTRNNFRLGIQTVFLD